MRKIYTMVLAVGLAVGAPWAVTSALFSDSASVGSNAFTSGSVDISTDPASALLSLSGMAPGDSETAPMVVSNDGSLAQRYSLTSTATNADSKGLKNQLVLTIKSVDATLPGTPCDDFDGSQLYTGDLDGSSGVVLGDITAGDQSGDRALAASAEETLCFKVALPSSTGNEYQDAATTATFVFDAEQTANNS
jgi:predicted ribosomally synthesized peptide with SipW-like signal peptide